MKMHEEQIREDVANCVAVTVMAILLWSGASFVSAFVVIEPATSSFFADGPALCSFHLPRLGLRGPLDAWKHLETSQ